MLSVPIMLSRPSLRPVSTPRAVARGGGWGRCGGGCPRRSCGPCLRCWSPRGVLSLTRRAGVVCRSSLVGFSSVSLYAPPLVRAPFVVAAVPRGGGGGPSPLSLSSPLLSSPLTVAVVSLCPVPGLPGRGCPPPPLVAFVPGDAALAWLLPDDAAAAPAVGTPPVAASSLAVVFVILVVLVASLPVFSRRPCCPWRFRGSGTSPSPSWGPWYLSRC